MKLVRPAYPRGRVRQVAITLLLVLGTTLVSLHRTPTSAQALPLTTTSMPLTVSWTPSVITWDGQLDGLVPVGQHFGGSAQLFDPACSPATSDVGFVTWGDGTTDPIPITGPCSALMLSGGHTYLSPGIFPVTIFIKGSDGSVGIFTGSFQAVVVDTSTPMARSACALQVFRARHC